VFHLRKGGHNGEQHRPHGCRCVDVTSAEIQDTKARTPAAEFIGKSEHVLSGSPEPVQSRDDEGVTLHERVKCLIELGS
jgi:hypothetical protein